MKVTTLCAGCVAIVIAGVTAVSAGSAQQSDPFKQRPMFRGRLVDGLTGQPMPDVPVGVACRSGDMIGMQGYPMVTDALGEVVLDAGPFTQCQVGQPQLSGYTRDPERRLFDVGPGETVSTVKLWPEGRIEGRLVASPDSKNLVGSQIRLFGPLPRWGPAVPSKTTPADPEGRFAFQAVEMGSYIVRAAGFEAETSWPTVEVRPGASTSVEFAARRLPVFNVSGRIRSADVSVANLNVWLDDGTAPSNSGFPRFAMVTAADGEFRFAEVPKGPYKVRVEAGDRFDPRTPKDKISADAAIVVDRDVTDVVVTIDGGVEIRGAVRYDSPFGGFGGLIGFSSVDRQYGFWLSPEQGKYPNVRAPAGNYLVYLPGQAPRGWQLDSIMLDGLDISEEPFRLTATSPEFVVTYTRRRTEIHGKVRDAGGVEDGAATVIVFSSDPGRWGGTESALIARRVKTILTTQRGSYSIMSLPPGEYFVAAVVTTLSPANQKSLELLRRLAPTATRVRIEYDKPVEQDMVRTELR